MRLITLGLFIRIQRYRIQRHREPVDADITGNNDLRSPRHATS